MIYYLIREYLCPSQTVCECQVTEIFESEITVLISERRTLQILYLQQFNFSIQHIDGKNNNLADYLSRTIPGEPSRAQDGQSQ